MKRLPLALLALSLLLFAAGCDSNSDDSDGPTTVKVTANGTVVQILPGPAAFAEEAQPVIAEFPAKLQQRFNTVAQKGPFSNNTAQISGNISITMENAGPTNDSGDALSGSAEFQSQDGTHWRFEFDRVNPNDNPSFAPRRGGVVTDFRFHGPSVRFTPLMVLVESAASSWGFARVYRNGELVKEAAPFHFMLTTQTRAGEEGDFDYLCYACSPDKEMTQAHLISRTPPSQGPLYEGVPGGYFHLSWQNATFERSGS